MGRGGVTQMQRNDHTNGPGDHGIGALNKRLGAEKPPGMDASGNLCQWSVSQRGHGLEREAVQHLSN